MPSSLPSLDEIRRVFRLLGECTELGADPVVWRQHLANQCSRLTKDCFVSFVEAQIKAHPGRLPQAVTATYFNGGALPNPRFDLIARFMERPAEISPTVPALLSTGEPTPTRLRSELVPDNDWYRSCFFQEYLRPLGLHDQMTSIDLAAPETVSVICCLSYERERFTSIRATRLLLLLQQELTRLKLAGKLAPVGGFSLTSLPPRQLEIMAGLLQGDGEKQLALRLGISRHTVHDHLKALHLRLGVSTRGELASRCARFQPVLEHLRATPQ